MNLPVPAGSQPSGTEPIFLPKKKVRRWPAFFGGALAGAAVALAVIWGESSLPGFDDTISKSAHIAARVPRNEAPKQTAASPEAHPVPDRTGLVIPTRLDRCREIFAAQMPALRAAAPAMDQWEVHIGAMNKLVTGAITLDQAWQFWNQTRRGAMGRLRTYESAAEALHEQTARCPQGGHLHAAPRDLRNCTDAVAAKAKQLHMTAVALGRWKAHVHHMEMLRTGDMTPEAATQMWLATWRQGDIELQTYRAAANEAQGLAC